MSSFGSFFAPFAPFAPFPLLFLFGCASVPHQPSPPNPPEVQEALNAYIEEAQRVLDAIRSGELTDPCVANAQMDTVLDLYLEFLQTLDDANMPLPPADPGIYATVLKLDNDLGCAFQSMTFNGQVVSNTYGGAPDCATP